MISGGGAYADEWHDFASTSARVAQLIAELGYEAEITDDVDHALSSPQCRLLVVNIGRPVEPRPPDVLATIRSGLAGHLAGGGALLGMHSSITSLTTLPEWRRTFGGAWIQGRAMHPPKGPATLLRTIEHPISAGLPTISVDDERYSYLDTESDLEVVYTHEHDERRHPVVWVRPQGPARVVYDALGHDLTSYDSADHRRLLRQSVHWLLDRP